MTLKKGIILIDLWIAHRVQLIKELEEGNVFTDKEMTKVFIDCDKRVIENLRQIKKEIQPNCKHPKKMHDICKGQKYCMSCNLDL